MTSTIRCIWCGSGTDCHCLQVNQRLRFESIGHIKTDNRYLSPVLTVYASHEIIQFNVLKILPEDNLLESLFGSKIDIQFDTDTNQEFTIIVERCVPHYADFDGNQRVPLSK